VTTVTGVPRIVWPGLRTTVVMSVGPGRERPFYTFNQWKAALCERAYQQQRAITITPVDTLWGHCIDSVELAEETQAAS
jgi:hypothetical protein